jgi:ribosome-binding factor A
VPPSTRMRRVNGALRQVLAEAVARDLSDPRLGFLTITDVAASPDLREAKVYFTTLAARERRASQEALESARGVLQGRVAAELRTRHTPQLTFVYDRQREEAESLTRLIDKVVGEAGAARQDDPAGAEAPRDPGDAP